MNIQYCDAESGLSCIEVVACVSILVETFLSCFFLL